MKSRTTIAIVLIALGAANLAEAFSFSPTNQKAKVVGAAMFAPASQMSYSCAIHLQVRTGNGVVNAAVVAASTMAATYPCRAVRFQELPWPMKATGPSAGAFGPVRLEIPGFGACAQTAVVFTAAANGVWTLSPSNRCIAGILQSLPAITVVRCPPDGARDHPRPPTGQCDGQSPTR